MLVILSSMLLASCVQSQTSDPSQTSPSPTSATPNSPIKPAAPTYTAQPPAIKPENNPSNGGIDGPLSVVIESPAENVVVNQSPIEISGQADPETVLTINDVIVLIGPDRRFSVKVDLEDGINLIEIVASDLDEHQEAYYLTVDYEKQP